jgi:hydroxymethylbilane synthase
MDKMSPTPDLPVLRIGTRGSALARWQAEWVADQLRLHGRVVELVEITTHGDQQRSSSLAALGGEGLFTKELQRALLDQHIDLAVHSLKDLPTTPVPGLLLAAVPPRANPADVLISQTGASLAELPANAQVGTGSVRRAAQLLAIRPDLVVKGIRGNVDTRLRKLDDGVYDALVLAAAGLERLGWHERITQYFPPDIMLPAVGQGALGIECRVSDNATRSALVPLDDAATHMAVAIERKLLAALGAGCSAPIGALATTREANRVHLAAVVLSGDGRQRLLEQEETYWDDAPHLAQRLANALLAQGAGTLIEAARP